MRECQICSTKLHGRRDQRFCSDQCRSHYHNQAHQTERKQLRRIEAMLRRNRKVLDHCLSNGINRAGLSALETMGFNSRLVTRIEDSEEQYSYYIYDIRFELQGNSVFFERISSILTVNGKEKGQ